MIYLKCERGSRILFLSKRGNAVYVNLTNMYAHRNKTNIKVTSNYILISFTFFFCMNSFLNFKDINWKTEI